MMPSVLAMNDAILKISSNYASKRHLSFSFSFFFFSYIFSRNAYSTLIENDSKSTEQLQSYHKTTPVFDWK